MARSRRSGATKPPGVREIAQVLGVSIGTVDRALHDRPGINAATRDQVLATAKALGYRPNLAARFLSSGRKLRISVNFPRELASFWDLVREGLRDAAHPFEANGVELVYRNYLGHGEGEREALADALEDQVHGIIMVPGFPERLQDLIRSAAEREIPLVYVNTDAPGTQRLTVIWADPVSNGAIVGELMGRFLQGEGCVLPVTGHLSTVEHARKLEGFRDALAKLWPGIEVAPVVEGHEDEIETYDKCRERFAKDRTMAGVYVSTANSPPVVRALQDEGLAGRVTVIATDLYLALAPLIDSGIVAATIDQRPWVQGQMAFQTLYRYLADGIEPPAVVGLSPHVVMRSNLELLLKRLRSKPEGAVMASPERRGANAAQAV